MRVLLIRYWSWGDLDFHLIENPTEEQLTHLGEAHGEDAYDREGYKYVRHALLREKYATSDVVSRYPDAAIWYDTMVESPVRKKVDMVFYINDG